MTVRIGLLNDVHYGFPDDREPGWIDDELRSVVQRFDEADLDMVIGLGDLIEHGTEQDDIERLQTLSTFLDGLDAPFYAIPGNHDIINMDGQSFLTHLDAVNERPFFSRDTDGKRIIGLDTTHRDPDLHPVAGRLGEEQREWLAEKLETEKDVYLLSHHLLHYRDLEGNFYFDDKPELAMAIDKRSVTKMLMDRETVRAVVSAHIHEEGMVEFHDVPHLTLGAMDKTDPGDEYRPSHAVLEITDDGFSIDAMHGRYGRSF